MEQNRSVYRSYLLRLWWDAGGHDWRASLQSTATQQTIHFATVEALLAFLLATPGEDGDDSAAPPQLQPPLSIL